MIIEEEEKGKRGGKRDWMKERGKEWKTEEGMKKEEKEREDKGK